MSKIELSDILGGYDLSKINNNFQSIEDALNNQVLYRDNPIGEPNALNTDVDVNGKVLYNLPQPTLASQAARLQDVQNAIIGNDSNLINFIQAGSGAVTRTAQNKMREHVSVLDYSSPTVADANGGGFLFSPSNVSHNAANGASLNSLYWGPGRVTTADGNKRGKFFSAIKAPPASLSNYNSVDTTFNGDYSKMHFAVEHRITGAATLGQPTTGYLYTPEAYPHFTYLFNTSGHNESLSGNDGRTAAVAQRVVVSQAGQGDAMCFNGSGFVQGTRAGSTNFLANPAVTLFAGDCAAGTDGVYLNPYETIISDNGFDVAGIGAVYNFKRTNATGAKSTFWGGERFQNIGTAYCDSLISAAGKFKVGLDLAMASLDLDTTRAAISLKAQQRIYFNNTSAASGSLTDNWRTTAFNGDYIHYDTATNVGLHFVTGGNDIMTTRSDAVVLTGTNGLIFQGSSLLRFAGSNQFGTGTSTATFTATNKPGATNSGPTNWLTVVLGGVSHQIPCFPT